MNEEGKIFLSVVIPTYERPDDLRACLESLSEEIHIGTPPYEIIVTDDSKSDESRRMVEKEFPNVFWGKGKQNGPAGNRNAGVDRAKGEWIVFLDDDCIAQEGYLKAYAKAIRTNPDTQVFEGRIFADRPRKTWAEGCPENEEGGMLWTSNLCVNRELFIVMGGLDERFRIAYEDVDYALRLKKEGKHSIFISDAAVCHPWRPLTLGGKNWKNKGYELESVKLFVKKHNLNEVINLRVFLKSLMRKLTADQITSYRRFRFKGHSILMHDIMTNIYVILFILKYKWLTKKK